MNAYRRTLMLACTLLLAAPATAPALEGARTLAATGTIQVAFPPDENANALILQALREAKKTVLVQAFSFTSNEIAFALIEAKRRGAEVRMIVDGEQLEKLDNNRVGLVARAGIPVWLDEQHQSAHNKILVIDAETDRPIVVTGSMNFTYSGQFKNAENLLVLRGNKPLAEAYAANWRRHREHSRPFHR
jgi:phosphatidylserine/phosphatidylglycerophosphate/cardiolipin synthase-like enzyme